MSFAVGSLNGSGRPSVSIMNFVAAILAAGVLLTSIVSVKNEAASSTTTTTTSGNATAHSMTLDDVKRICNNKKVKIVSLAQMSRAINAAKMVDGLCRRRYMASINELEGILRIPREDLCNEESFELIRSFHFRFISPLRTINKRVTQFEPDPKEVVRAQLHPEPRKYSLEFDDYNQILMIPIAVRHFWLSFMLQLSGQCKRNLLDNLKSDVAKYLDQKDELVVGLFDKDNPIGRLMSDGLKMANFDNVVYMPELEGEIKGANKPSGRQVFVRTEANESSPLYSLVRACQTHFKPIYEKLLMPIIKLVKLGYDYQGDKLTLEERRELLGPKVKSWLGLVNVCEIFHRVIVLHNKDNFDGEDKGSSGAAAAGTTSGTSLPEKSDPDEENEVEGQSGDNQFVTITQEEAEALVKQAKTNEAAAPSAAINGADLSQIEMDNTIEYTQTKFNRMEDELWITSERELDLELSRKPGNTNPFGFKGFLRRLGGNIRKGLVKLDPDRFAKYRHNSLWWAGVLNLISAITNIVSTAITAIFVIIVLAA